MTDPFAVLGLDAGADLSDDDVRAAWRRIAASCHPDRDDGGSPERYASAAAAYATLRTAYGRGEARADLRELSRRGPALKWRPVPWRFPARALVAAAVCVLAFLSAGWSPGTLALFAGAATWLCLGLRGARDESRARRSSHS